MYNDLKRKDQKELLRQMIDKVVIDATGTIRLELRSPSGYLRDISREMGQNRECSSCTEKQKTGISVGLSEPGYLTRHLWCGEDRTAIEHYSGISTSQFLQQLAFPQRERVLHLTGLPS